MGNLFEEIKTHVSTVEVATRYGIELRQRGSRWWACCPLHGEKTPSFTINSEEASWHCYGCGAGGGDSISFTAKLFNERQIDAARRLAGDFGILLPDDRPGPGRRVYLPQKREPTPNDLLHALKARNNEEFRRTVDLYWQLHHVITQQTKKPEEDNSSFWEAVSLRAELERRLEALLDPESIFEHLEVDRDNESH